MKPIVSNEQSPNRPHCDKKLRTIHLGEQAQVPSHAAGDQRQELRHRLLRMIRDNEQARRRHERKAR